MRWEEEEEDEDKDKDEAESRVGSNEGLAVCCSSERVELRVVSIDMPTRAQLGFEKSRRRNGLVGADNGITQGDDREGLSQVRLSSVETRNCAVQRRHGLGIQSLFQAEGRQQKQRCRLAQRRTEGVSNHGESILLT